jgi:hypothetical protein
MLHRTLVVLLVVSMGCGGRVDASPGDGLVSSDAGHDPLGTGNGSVSGTSSGSGATSPPLPGGFPGGVPGGAPGGLPGGAADAGTAPSLPFPFPFPLPLPGQPGSTPPLPPSTPASGPVACGGSTCDARTQDCCLTLGGGRCVPNGACVGPLSLSCESAKNCEGGDVCCIEVGGGSLTAACRPSCGGGRGPHVQVCRSDAECTHGTRCQRTPLGFGFCR